MLNRIRRRFLERRCSREMDTIAEYIDEQAVNIAHENDVSEQEAREFVIYAFMRNPVYRISAKHALESYGYVLEEDGQIG